MTQLEESGVHPSENVSRGSPPASEAAAQSMRPTQHFDRGVRRPIARRMRRGDNGPAPSVPLFAVSSRWRRSRAETLKIWFYTPNQPSALRRRSPTSASESSASDSCGRTRTAPDLATHEGRRLDLRGRKKDVAHSPTAPALLISLLRHLRPNSFKLLDR